MLYFKDYKNNESNYKNSNDFERYVENDENERKELDREETMYEYGKNEKQTYEH